MQLNREVLFLSYGAGSRDRHPSTGQCLASAIARCGGHQLEYSWVCFFSWLLSATSQRSIEV